MNRLKQLTASGQSLWLDYIKRSFVAGGELRKLIAEDGLTGIISNPTIFDEAISRGDEYESAIRSAAQRNESAEEAYKEIVIADVQSAADELRGVFERTQGRDGYVSLEVSPHLAYDTEGSIAQAREFWERVARPNLFVKIPGTREGLPAIRRSIAAGITSTSRCCSGCCVTERWPKRTWPVLKTASPPVNPWIASRLSRASF